MTVITLNPKLSFATGHLHSAKRHARARARDVGAASQHRSTVYRTIVPDTDGPRGIPRSRRLYDINPVKVVPRASPLASMIFFFYKSRSSRSTRFLSLPCRISHRSRPSVSFVFSLTSVSTIHHHLRQFTDYRPHPRAPYGGVTNDSAVYEYGLFGRDRDGKGLSRANALSSADGEEREREGTKTPELFSISTLVGISIFSFFYFFNYVLAFFFLLYARPFGFQDR